MREDGAHGELARRFDQTGADGVAGEAGRVVDVELVHHGLPVFFHGLDTDTEFAGRLLVGVAFGNELQNFDLALGEGFGFAAVQRVLFAVLLILRQTFFDRGREGLHAAGYFAHGVGQGFGG